MSEVKIIEKHDLFTRWTHWVNFPLLTLMIWSGILIYWANDQYVALPDSIAKPLKIDHRLSTGMQWHFFLIWPFVINGLVFIATVLVTGRWRTFKIHRSTFPNAIRYALYDFKLVKTLPAHEDGPYNPAQKLSYIGVFILSALAVLSGFAIYKPVQLGLLTEALGGYEAARLEHFISMCLLTAFFFVHIAQVARAGWNQFRGMVTGYEVDDAK